MKANIKEFLEVHSLSVNVLEQIIQSLVEMWFNRVL